VAVELVVDPGVAAAYPGYRAGVIVASGVVNGPSDDAGSAAVAAAEERWADLARPADHPHIAAWREAFRSFGAKPKRHLCSAEALMARAMSGEGLPRINRLVDCYNAVSVRHAVPVGGEDLDRVTDPVRLVAATGNEPFDDEHPRPGEIVWADTLGVTCRRWNWRQCTRTRLVEGTTRAYFLFDALPPFGDDELAAAMAELEALLHGGWPEATLASWVVAPR
jgi:DNA/RNA-binding domain of Phe-tRNA-synthetase-like protein